MDPNANLREQRELIQKILFTKNATAIQLAEWGIRLAELAEALDNWLIGKGAYPRDWIPF